MKHRIISVSVSVSVLHSGIRSAVAPTSIQVVDLFRCHTHTPSAGGIRRRAAFRLKLVLRKHHHFAILKGLVGSICASSIIDNTITKIRRIRVGFRNPHASDIPILDFVQVGPHKSKSFSTFFLYWNHFFAWSGSHAFCDSRCNIHTGLE